jgi:hypothetical protein
VDVSPRYPARRLACHGVCHDRDDAAEVALIEAMSVLSEKAFRMPADRGGGAEHVGDRVRVDLADLAQIRLARRPDGRN